MTETCFLGVDLGAESGRVMAGLFDGKRIRIEQVHRFANGAVSIGNTLRWDVLRLWSEIQDGLAKGAATFGKTDRIGRRRHVGRRLRAPLPHK
jgi:rhamnulokinase